MQEPPPLFDSLRDGPKSPSRGPKGPPRRHQEGPTRAVILPQERPRAPRKTCATWQVRFDFRDDCSLADQNWRQ
eukprot:8464321-Pyramimonas_sp.AAC.1